MIGQGVSLSGLHLEDTIFTWNVSGTTSQADLGKAVSIDTSAPRTVKLAADGDVVLGYLSSLENRVQEGIVVGAVELHGGTTLTYSGTAPTVGQSVQGAGAGVVKALANNNRNVVVAVDATNTKVEVVFF